MGDIWDPLQNVRCFNPQEGTLMDLGRQLIHRGSGEAVWNGSGLGNWQSSRSNHSVGCQNLATADNSAMCTFETGSVFDGGSTSLPDLTNPRQFLMGEMKQQHVRLQNLENAKPRVMVSNVVDSRVPSRDPRYYMDYSPTGYQLERELDFHRQEAERGVWRSNFDTSPEGRLSTGLNSVGSTERSLINGYVSRGMITALDHSLTPQQKSGIDYTSSISATTHARMVEEGLGALATSNVYGTGGTAVGLNSSISAQLNSNSGVGYSGVESEITSVVPSLSYELPDFQSAAFGYSTSVYEERVATNDSTGEPIDCLMGEFQAAVVPDAMSPAMAPIFKRSSWEIVNDGFDLLSHGSCTEISSGFPWQSDVLVSDICQSGHTSSSFLLTNNPKLSSAMQRSSASALDEPKMPEFSLVPREDSVQPNLPPGKSHDILHERVGSETVSFQREGSGSETVSTQWELGSSEPISVHEGQDLAEKRQALKEVAKEKYLNEQSGGEAATISDGDRGAADKMDRAMRVMTKVMRFGEALDSDDSKACNSALGAVQDLCSVSGDYTQRVAHYFCEALSNRLAGQCGKTVAAEEPYQLPHDLLEDCKFTEACPYTKFVHLSANQALLEAMEGEDSVHIIDVGTMQGVQWSTLIQALVSPAGLIQALVSPGGPKVAVTPKKIRITGIASPKLGPNASDSLLRTGKRLTEFAEVLGLKIEFQSILEEVQNLSPELFQIREGDMVAVNFMLQLHQHIGQEGGERVTKILKLVQSLRPKVVVMAEYEAAINTETSDTLTCLLDAMKHYCSIFQSLEVLPRDCLERSRIERFILGKEIGKMLSTTTERGAMKHASFAQWKDLFKGLGFQAVKPSHYSCSQARLLLWMYEGPYQILNNSDSLSLSWHDRVIITVSAWHCP